MVLVYFLIGLACVIPFTRVVATYLENEFPGRGLDGLDVFMAIFLAFVGGLIWPLVLLGVFVARAALTRKEP